MYFHRYDQNYPTSGAQRVEAEFEQLSPPQPAQPLTRISHDRMAAGSALGGVGTTPPGNAASRLRPGAGPDGEAVATSRYAADTLIHRVGSRRGDGPDHGDSHRERAVGTARNRPQWSARGIAGSNALRTIEDILGTEHINLNTALPALGR